MRADNRGRFYVVATDQASSPGELLRLYRLRAGVSQQELATRAGMSVRALRDIEQGRVERPRARSIHALATTLDLADTDRTALLAAAASESSAVDSLRVGVLGPMSVTRGDTAVVISSTMLRDLLGLLAMQPNQVISRDEIVDVLWGDDPPRTCLSLVHGYVAQLRTLLEPRRRPRAEIQTVRLVRNGYRLELADDQLDVARFDALAAAGTEALSAGHLETANDRLAQALRCWRGPVLADASDRVRAHPSVLAIGQRRSAAVCAYADVSLALVRCAEAVTPLRAVLADEPLHERVAARLMLALAGSGEQAAALQLYTDIRGRLDDELGVEPGADLQAAHLRVVRGELPAVATPTTADPRPAQLPADVAGFTGRREYLRHLDALLDDDPSAVVICAIAGTAGVGKTALAVHWGNHVRDRFPDGQLYVNLQGYARTPPLRPIEALARFLHALGMAAERVPTDVDSAAALFRTMLARKRMLVVLDNASSADQVRPLIPASPGCFVVVTSRDALAGLVAQDGARRLTLDVLTPGESRGLLRRVLGADRVDAEPEAAASLAELCCYLPLALRISAANLSGRRQRSIASHVEELRADNRLAALAVDGDEQVAVRAAFDLSYQRLPEAAATLFRLLGAAPLVDFTAEAAAALAGTTVDDAQRALDRLAGAHLVEETSDGRFAFHDLLRHFARERAQAEDTGETEAAVGRLLGWYLRTTDAAARLLYGRVLRLPAVTEQTDLAELTGLAGLVETFRDHVDARAWIDAERTSLVAAAVHAAEHGPIDVAWRLADGLRGYFRMTCHVVDWLAVGDAGLAAAERDGDPRALAAVRLSLADAHRTIGQYRQALEHYAAALEAARAAGWRESEATVLGNIGTVHWYQGRLEQASDHYQRAATIHRAVDRHMGTANTLTSLGCVYLEWGRLDQAVEQCAQALELHCELGSRDGEAIGLDNLGKAYQAQGHLDRSVDHHTRALALFREVGDREGAAYALNNLARVNRDAGRLGDAMAFGLDSHALATETGELRAATAALNAIGTIHLRQRRPDDAVARHEQALALARRTGTRYLEVEALIGLAEARATVADADLALSIAAGIGYRILEGRALTVLAGLALDHCPETAAGHATRALAVHRDTGARLDEARTLAVLARATDGAAARAHLEHARALFTEIGSADLDATRLHHYATAP